MEKIVLILTQARLAGREMGWRRDVPDSLSKCQEEEILFCQDARESEEEPARLSSVRSDSCMNSMEYWTTHGSWSEKIQMRGNVLNKRGMYNRCKLTRLLVDCEWEERMWKEAWAPRVVTIDE